MTGYALAVFPRSTDPIPVAEHVGLDVEQVIGVIAGALHVTHDKASVPYFVGCELVESAYTPNMAKRMGKQVGKQRSAACAGQARLLTFDFDQLTAAEAKTVFLGIQSLNCACLTYSSYSHGSPNKEGKNFRVVIFLSAPVNGQEYTALWKALNSEVFAELADPTSRHVYQQQGKWATNPVWSDKAFKYVGRGEPLCCDRWISNVSLNVTTPSAPSVSVSQLDLNKVRQALKWIDMTQYEHWMTTGAALKILDEKDFERFWVDRSDPSDDPRHDPQRVWDGLKPNMPAGAAIGTLLRMAKNGATAAVNKCLELPEFTPEGQSAAIYLLQNHPRHWRELHTNGGH